jgi:hypothetical protein
VRAINRGGCAIAALVMYRWLKQRKEKCHIVYFYSYSCKEYRSENFKIKIGLKNAEPSPCLHAMVEYKGLYYDSSSGTKFSPHQFHHRLPEPIVVRTINESTNWNSDFDRKAVAQIMKKTKIDLSDIKV